MAAEGKIKIVIGSSLYELVLVEGEIVVNGRRVASACRHDRHTIELSDRVPLEIRDQVVAVAVSVAWQRAARAWRPIPLVVPQWES